ncbi:MAG: ParA family protein [Rhodospirillales bacterium]|jgi:chromosome partitioning protein|nr:ParA family protein [Rhodospirillales bacterium]
MFTILVTNTKGGCGKTTIATGLAGAFAQTGWRTVLADCDRQKSSLGWASRRPAGAPAITPVNWSKDTQPLPPKTQLLVIDSPAALKRKRLDELVRIADVVILPVLPSVFDETTTRRFLSTLDKLKPVRKGKRPIAVVGNRMRARTRTAARLNKFMSEVGQRSVASLRDTQLYPASAAAGLSLFDLATRRAANFVDDWQPLLSFIDEIKALREG